MNNINPITYIKNSQTRKVTKAWHTKNVARPCGEIIIFQRPQPDYYEYGIPYLLNQLVEKQEQQTHNTHLSC